MENKHSFFKWKPEYNSGIKPIDEQHQKLVQYIADLYCAVYEGNGAASIYKIIDGLVEYTETHFWFEEDLIEKAGYPDIEEHKKIHKAFVEKISAFQQKSEKKLPITFQLVQFLKDWLVDHILGDDRKYIPYVEKMPKR